MISLKRGFCLRDKDINCNNFVKFNLLDFVHMVCVSIAYVQCVYIHIYVQMTHNGMDIYSRGAHRGGRLVRTDILAKLQKQLMRITSNQLSQL